MELATAMIAAYFIVQTLKQYEFKTAVCFSLIYVSIIFLVYWAFVI